MMRILTSCAAFLLASSNAMAVPAINLSPVKGKKTVDVTKNIGGSKNITGSCGNATVIVKGVDRIYKYDYTFGIGRIIVRTASGTQLVLDDESPVLNDRNGLACVSTKAGKRLLLWSQCGGNSSLCDTDYSFFVIDPDHAVFLAPKDPNKGTCDEVCAANLLHSDLPEHIDDDPYLSH